MEHILNPGTCVCAEHVFIPIEANCCVTVQSYMSNVKDLKNLEDFKTINFTGKQACRFVLDPSKEQRVVLLLLNQTVKEILV